MKDIATETLKTRAGLRKGVAFAKYDCHASISTNPMPNTQIKQIDYTDLARAESFGLQTTALQEQRLLFGQDLLSFSQLPFQVLQTSPLLQNLFHLLVQPAFLFLDLLFRRKMSTLVKKQTAIRILS